MKKGLRRGSVDLGNPCVENPLTGNPIFPDLYGKGESLITGTSPLPGRISFVSTRNLSISLDLTGDL
jgi:hypothetical protein